MKTKRNARVDAETFVKTWQSSNNINEFVKATGMKATSAATRARYYREKGIKLKKYPRNTVVQTLDVNRLARLAASTARATAAPKAVAHKRTKRRSKK